MYFVVLVVVLSDFVAPPEETPVSYFPRRLVQIIIVIHAIRIICPVALCLCVFLRLHMQK